MRKWRSLNQPEMKNYFGITYNVYLLRKGNYGYDDAIKYYLKVVANSMKVHNK